MKIYIKKKKEKETCLNLSKKMEIDFKYFYVFACKYNDIFYKYSTYDH